MHFLLNHCFTANPLGQSLKPDITKFNLGVLHPVNQRLYEGELNFKDAYILSEFATAVATEQQKERQ